MWVNYEKSGFSESKHFWVVLVSLFGLLNVVNGQSNNANIYDFIVVGGGTGGCAVAARLAESGKHSVLLIEAGGVPEKDQDIPALQGQFMGSPHAVQGYDIVQQTNAGLASNGSLRLLVGKGLGGGSSLNGMFFNRGNQHDYNYWARLTQDDTWNYTNILPYLKKIESYAGEYPSDEHGYDGPITVSRPQYAPGMAEWLQAGRELGYPNLDPNGPQKLTFTTVEFAKKFGRRVSSFVGYIKPLLQKKNKNLRILTKSEAVRILFDGNRAIGVKYRTNGTRNEFTANARNEIILTAGVIGTPVLLMRSGVGPRSVLDDAHITPKIYLPVGKYLHDHVGIPVPVILNNKSAVFEPNADLNDDAWMVYNQFGDGPYSTSLGTAGQAFLPSSTIPPSEKLRNWGDLQLIAHNIPQIGPPRPSHELTQLRKGETYATWVAVVARPKSRGSVRLNSSNVDGPPIIDFNYLNHPIDMQVAIDGAKWISKICEETAAFRGLGCRLPAPLSACKRFKFRSDKYWRCYVKQVGRSWLHPAGSCSMGRGWDNLQATVDSKLRVIGLESLRIADASTMPAVVNSQTMVAVYAIAEKAADMILLEWADFSHPAAVTVPTRGNATSSPANTRGVRTKGRRRVKTSRYLARVKV